LPILTPSPVQQEEAVPNNKRARDELDEPRDESSYGTTRSEAMKQSRLDDNAGRSGRGDSVVAIPRDFSRLNSAEASTAAGPRSKGGLAQEDDSKQPLQENGIQQRALREKAQQRVSHELLALQMLNNQMLATPPTATTPTTPTDNRATTTVASAETCPTNAAAPQSTNVQREQHGMQSLLFALSPQQEQQNPSRVLGASEAYTQQQIQAYRESLVQQQQQQQQQHPANGLFAGTNAEQNWSLSDQRLARDLLLRDRSRAGLAAAAAAAAAPMPSSDVLDHHRMQELMYQMNHGRGAVNNNNNNHASLNRAQASSLHGSGRNNDALLFPQGFNGTGSSDLLGLASLSSSGRYHAGDAAATAGIGSANVTDELLQQLLQQGLPPRLHPHQGVLHHHNQHLQYQQQQQRQHQQYAALSANDALLTHLLQTSTNPVHQPGLSHADQQMAALHMWQQTQQGLFQTNNPQATQLHYNSALLHSLQGSLSSGNDPVLQGTVNGRGHNDVPLQSTIASSATAIPMEASSDVDQLSKYQVLVRRQLEYFVSQKDDAEYSVQGRKKQARLGQVGIRCKHCSHLPHRLRGRGAGYYPAKLSGVYQAAQNMATNHLNQFCNSIPADIRETLRSLRGGRHDSAAGGGKQYWADACIQIGLVEDEDDGLRFRRRGADESSNNASLSAGMGS
jgi:hypothetical protein